MIYRHVWVRGLCSGLLAFFLSSVPVWLGICFGIGFVTSESNRLNSSFADILNACYRFDASHYRSIAEDGYSYDPDRASVVAFFPAYPIMGRFITTLTAFDTRSAMLMVSNSMLLGSFILLSIYLSCRSVQDNSHTRFLMLTLFGVWPSGFFFRLPYSESTFLLLSLLVLLGIVRRWPLSVVVFISGAATATRPVGLALPMTLAWYILSDRARGSVARRLLLATICSIAACWGLLSYITYQYFKFGNALAFAETQKHWSYVGPSQNRPIKKIESLLAAEPIWSVYTSDSIRNWRRCDDSRNPFFNLFFWNPILFILALVLVLLGAVKSWLSSSEIVLSLGLLGIPYITRAYEMSMASHARFASVVIPAYIVLGRILAAGPEWLEWSVFSFLSTMLMTWSALFASGYLFY